VRQEFFEEPDVVLLNVVVIFDKNCQVVRTIFQKTKNIIKIGDVLVFENFILLNK